MVVPGVPSFAYGFFGGVLLEIWGMYNLRRTPPEHRPDWINSLFYWFWTFLMMVMGGLLSLAYSANVEITPILGINIGASAPSIIAAFAEKAPNISPGSID